MLRGNTLWRNSSTHHRVNARLFTLDLPRCLSLSLFAFFSFCISGVSPLLHFPQIFHLFPHYLGKPGTKQCLLPVQVSQWRMHFLWVTTFFGFFILQSQVTPVIIVVPRVPGNSDQGKQCLFLVWQTHFLCHNLTFVSPRKIKSRLNSNSVKARLKGNHSICGWCFSLYFILTTEMRKIKSCLFPLYSGTKLIWRLLWTYTSSMSVCECFCIVSMLHLFMVSCGALEIWWMPFDARPLCFERTRNVWRCVALSYAWGLGKCDYSVLHWTTLTCAYSSGGWASDFFPLCESGLQKCAAFESLSANCLLLMCQMDNGMVRLISAEVVLWCWNKLSERGG